jgi:FMN reductase
VPLSDHQPTILGISGSLSVPSRTASLVRAVLTRFQPHAATRLIDLASDAPALFATLPKGPRSSQAREIIDAVESADLLVVGSPVYRASYTGALKHLFDLVDYRALEGTPVMLCATGGTPLHGLMPDQALRPLFAFFKALALPTSIYALESDFDQHELRSIDVSDRIDRAAAEARQQLRLRAAQHTGTILPFAASA